MKQAVCVLIPLPPQEGATVKFLAVSRRNDTSKWGFPGGKVDPGECTASAAVRETLEEIGLALTREDLIPLYAGACPGKGPDDTFWVTTYLAKWPDGLSVTDLKMEAGLTPDWMTRKQLGCADCSPFADYNEQVFKAFSQYR